MTTDLFDNTVPVASFSAYNDENFATLIKSNLGNARTNDEFYKKLLELKNEQKKTLEYMQELYNQKQILKGEIEKSEQNLNDLKISASKPYNQNITNFERNTVSAYDQNSVNNIASHYHEENAKLVDLNNNNNHHIDETINSEIDCKICAETHKYVVINEKLVNSKPPLPAHQSNGHYRTNDDSLQTSINDEKIETIDSNLKRIEKMWDEFNLDDYNHLKHAKVSAFNNSDSLHSTGQRVKFEEDWATKVTVPAPFKMTLRDQTKAGKKSKKILEIEEEKRRKEEKELEELNKKFKAAPVPEHVYQPIFEEKQKEEELRKLRLKLESKEYLESVPKPFKCAERERRNSFSGQTSHEQNVIEGFIANPLPEFYFDNDYLSERRKEQELYRQIRSQMRSHTLLKNSKLPKNMRILQEKKRMEVERESFSQHELNKLTSKERAKLRKSYEVPNYDELYKKFQTELETKRAAGQSKVTVCQPFNLKTNVRAAKKTLSNTASRISSAKYSSGRNSALSHNDSTARLMRSMSASMDTVPIQHTDGQKLRESVTKNKINDIALKEARKEHIDKMKKIKAENMKKQMESKLKHPSVKEVGKAIDMKTRRIKLDEQRKQEEFEKKLDEMHKKVESRKFLFEIADEENARKALEKKYRETLKNAGLSEDALNDKRSGKKVAKPVTAKSYVFDDNWINE